MTCFLLSVPFPCCNNKQQRKMWEVELVLLDPDTFCSRVPKWRRCWRSGKQVWTQRVSSKFDISLVTSLVAPVKKNFETGLLSAAGAWYLRLCPLLLFQSLKGFWRWWCARQKIDARVKMLHWASCWILTRASKILMPPNRASPTWKSLESLSFVLHDFSHSYPRAKEYIHWTKSFSLGGMFARGFRVVLLKSLFLWDPPGSSFPSGCEQKRVDLEHRMVKLLQDPHQWDPGSRTPPVLPAVTMPTPIETALLRLQTWALHVWIGANLFCFGSGTPASPLNTVLFTLLVQLILQPNVLACWRLANALRFSWCGGLQESLILLVKFVKTLGLVPFPDVTLCCVTLPNTFQNRESKFISEWLCECHAQHKQLKIYEIQSITCLQSKSSSSSKCIIPLHDTRQSTRDEKTEQREIDTVLLTDIILLAWKLLSDITLGSVCVWWEQLWW